ncbi:pentapeptide repeat-containing protein [Lentzea sp. NBRC 102530]|uniref:pentapeptide repeat-containing protein n=1 Tax=Lentzea sp. NBRC 102530 TaxID=3032201 RepID=UPI0024A023CC|nr:pentapeptide repeat-containing protein [Lentzea sp. NBRC 102530]GLY48371.1 hypothetical protein Lesp01_20270 [Lentzea sp. NBRC 102530]
MGTITWQYWALGALAMWLLLRLWQRSRREAQSPVWTSIVSWLLIAALVAAAAGGGLLWLLGWPTMPKQAAFTTTEMLDLLKIGLAVVAGFGGVVALAVNYRKQRVTEAAHLHALNQEEREHTKLFYERFKVAAELLAGEQIGLRVAGVSAMASLADDWEAQRQMCVDTLIDAAKLAKDDTEVVTKIFRAMRSRLDGQREAVSWSALTFDFSGFEFDGADFGGLRFESPVIFDGAEFTGELTSFDGTVFHGPLRFTGATFTETVVNFRDAVFAGRPSDFVGCTFDRTTIDLGGSELRSRRLHFDRCEFVSSELQAEDMNVDTAAVRIEHSALTDSTLNFTEMLGADADRGSLGFLFVEACTLVECTVLLRSLDPEHQFVWWRDNAVTGGTFEISPKPAKWLKVRGEEPTGP